jgi:hypothetical protein
MSALSLRAQTLDAVDLPARLQQVGERLAKYYERARSIVCSEKVVIQPLESSLTFSGIARELKYELRLEWTPGGPGTAEVKIVRELVAIGGRAPKPKDKRKCMDPRGESGDSLSMLLPLEQANYHFKLAGTGKTDGRPALMVDFKPVHRPKPVAQWLDKDDDDCVSVELTTQGRIWIDTESDEVLRLDQHIPAGITVDIPREHQSPGMDPWLTFERYDETMRFKPVSFQDPEERLVLPASTDILQVARGGHMRATHTFSNYRRFVTGGRVVKDGG